jgi:excisionase family DNA binding protein
MLKALNQHQENAPIHGRISAQRCRKFIIESPDQEGPVSFTAKRSFLTTALLIQHT